MAFFSTKTRNAGDEQKYALQQPTANVLNVFSNLLHSNKVGSFINEQSGIELTKSMLSNEYKENLPLISSIKETICNSNVILVNDEEKELLSKSLEETNSNKAEDETEKSAFV
jgi:hypothetical protein